MASQEKGQKVYKKGTVVTLKCNCTFVNSKLSKKMTLTQDHTEEELTQLANEFMWDNLNPNSWFEVEGEE